MIISHKYKFIFIKPTKVAGTSVEVALAKHCGKEDVITPISNYSSDSDSDKYEQSARNFGGFYNHIPPKEISKRVSKEVWDNYYKFTIVRNPWDQVVSRYCWSKSGVPKKGHLTKEVIFANLLHMNAYIRVLKRVLRKKNKVTTFPEMVASFRDEWKNTNYYFDDSGKPICDFYIKFENLQGDYKKVCNQLEIPYEELPRLKTKIRKDKKPYSEYYNSETREMVRRLFEKEIKFFDYKFKVSGDT